MMTRFRWRIAAIVSALVLIGPAIVWNTHPTLAVGPGQMTWTGSIWRDPACGTPAATFDVRLFRHIDQGGTTWRLCSNYSDWCWAPYGNDSSDALACSLGLPNDTLNDKVSSLRVVSVLGGDSCRVRLHEHANYGGAALTYWDPATVDTLVPWPNDVLSSARRVC